MNGYSKPGRYFPILVDQDDAAHPIEFTAEGCIPTKIEASQQTHFLVPMLATGTPTELKWPTGSSRLLVPKDNERLIACIATSPEISRIFAGNETAIPILLNPVDPLPGPAAAWESLDAIVLNTDLMARMGDDKIGSLLAAGVTLAAIGKGAPDDRWPWHLRRGLWILSIPIAGPVQSIDENAYLPTLGWMPGWSAIMRWQVFGAGLVFSVILLFLMSWNLRFMRIAVAIFILCFAAAICVWRSAFDPINRVGGDILIRDGKLLQRDEWVYQRAKSDCVATVPWRGVTHPVFPSSGAIDRSAIRLNVSGTGELSFIYQARTNHTMSFVRREITMDSPTAVQATTQSPMRELIKEEYLIENSSVIGESDGLPERWPSVLIDRHRQN